MRKILIILLISGLLFSIANSGNAWYPNDLKAREMEKFRDVNNKPAVDVAIVDSSGDHITNFGLAETVDAPASGDVTPIGGIAESTIPTEVADSDIVGLWYDTYGRPILKGYNFATGAIAVSPVSRGPIDSGYSQIIDETLDDSPTSVTSSAFFIGDKKKIAFILKYDETEVGNTVSGDLTLEVSPDNSTWYDYDIIIDGSGVDSPISSINYTVDTEDIFYLPENITFPYVRVTFTGTNTDVDDTIAIDVFLCWQK